MNQPPKMLLLSVRRRYAREFIGAGTSTSSGMNVGILPTPSQSQPRQQQQQLTTNKLYSTTSIHSVAGAGGTRGSRGHGWYVNYKAGNKGGRHLRGEYFDRDTVTECTEWNQQILNELGSQKMFMDIIKEPVTTTAPIPTTGKKNGRYRNYSSTDVDVNQIDGERIRLTFDIATNLMPETTHNFLSLCTDNEYNGSKFYRVEKNVGLCVGDILTNTGKSGKKANALIEAYPNTDPLRHEITNDPLAMWHVPGTLTMIVPKVGTVDSRFMICCTHAMHLDGIHRAFGQLDEASTLIAQNLFKTIITRNGVPTGFNLIIAQCGLVESTTSATPPTTTMTETNDNAETTVVAAV